MKQKTPPAEPTGKVKVSDTEAIKRLFTFGSFGLGKMSTKSANELPAGEILLINALRLFYAYRHNGFLLVEALDICTRHDVNPPTWVLVGINEAFQKFNKGYVTLEVRLAWVNHTRKSTTTTVSNSHSWLSCKKSSTVIPRGASVPHAELWRTERT